MYDFVTKKVELFTMSLMSKTTASEGEVSKAIEGVLIGIDAAIADQESKAKMNHWRITIEKFATSAEADHFMNAHAKFWKSDKDDR